MKVLCTVLSLALLGQCVSAVPLSRMMFPKQQKNSFITVETFAVNEQVQKVGLDLCPTCVSFTGQTINQLLNIILNVGVIGTCGELCSILAQETGSQVLGTVCNLLCDIVGVEEFIKLIEKADLDPIYFCELMTLCPINDNSDANITSFTVTPKSGPRGVFELDLLYETKNGTGTGEIGLAVETVDGLPVGGSFLNKAVPPGQYGGKITLKAERDPNCDPSQGPCENWTPGLYVVHLDLCYGECGSKHPHSRLLDSAQTNFTITN